MKDLPQPKDDELIATLPFTEGWKAFVRKLNKMEADAFESLLREPSTGGTVAAEVNTIRKIRAYPDGCSKQQ